MIEQLTSFIEILTKESALREMQYMIMNQLEKPVGKILEVNLTPEKKALYDMHQKIEKYDVKNIIKLKSEFSEGINQYIKTSEELNIYKNAGLKETEVNNRKCLIREDISISEKDDFGRDNMERMRDGQAPLDEKNLPIELHHIGQQNDSPLTELTQDEHRKNYSILHTKQESEIDRVEFAKIRADHWKARAQMLGGKNA